MKNPISFSSFGRLDNLDKYAGGTPNLKNLDVCEKKWMRKPKLPYTSGPKAFGTIPRVIKPNKNLTILLASLDKKRFLNEVCLFFCE